MNRIVSDLFRVVRTRKLQRPQVGGQPDLVFCLCEVGGTLIQHGGAV